jgi:hypothetical protein
LLHFSFNLISVQIFPFFFIPFVGSSSQMVHEGEGEKVGDTKVGALVGLDVVSDRGTQVA